MKVVLFEDDKRTGPDLQRFIKSHLPRGSRVVLFQASPDTARKRRPQEERLAEEVQKAPYEDAVMWVSDRDLSRIEHYEGLAETVISKVAKRYGIPLCKYARRLEDDVLKRQRSWGDSQIVLDSKSLEDLGKNIAIMAKGFAAISAGLKKLMPLNKVVPGKSTPAEVMAKLLGRPDLADQISLYGSGDQSMAAEILPFANSKTQVAELRTRLPSLLGYWLYDSLLRFPGIVVNETSAASHLDIAPSQFEKPSIRRLFESAVYKGPFADGEEPRWWRGDLDEIVQKAEAQNGNEFVAKKLGRRVAHCLDSETRARAGWYCMVKKVPVSEKNSVGNISWFPPGADLARIRKDVFEQMGPWLGLN